jgi:type IV pilus assembly protein PilB
MNKKEKILYLLEADKKIPKGKADEIIKLSLSKAEDIEKILLDENLINIEELIKYKAKVYDLPYIGLSDKKVDYDILNLISKEAAQNYKMVCFERSKGEIKVGITEPDNINVIEIVNFLAKDHGVSVKIYLISDLSFQRVFKQYQDIAKEISTALESKAKEEEKIKKTSVSELENVIKTAPVAKIVSVIIRHAVEGRASDIHIEPLVKETRIRYRIDGVLHTSLILPLSVHESVVSRIKVLAGLKLDETRIPQDGRFRLIISDKEVDFRVSILTLLGEEKVVMRILDVSQGAPTLNDLGYSGRSLNILEKYIKEPSGLILVTGPTGSGKSTTLFSMLNIINKEGVNISTLEDPIEYYVKGVNQSQIKPEIAYTFANGLRSLLRQDPDIIMVGEIRDNETTELAIHAGLTGHLVLSTLHTNSALGAIPRLVDMKIEPFLLASTLKLVIAQRLVRKICPDCKVNENLPEDIFLDIKKEIENLPNEVLEEIGSQEDLKNKNFYKGAGCPRCGNTGYRGRIAIVEMIEVNNETKKIIYNKNKIFDIEEIKKNQFFISIKQDGIIKCLQGLTTIEEVFRVIKE